MRALLLPSGPLFLTDAFLTPDPSEEQIIQTTLASIDLVRHFGVTPKVALLAHSNFGTSQYPSAGKCALPRGSCARRTPRWRSMARCMPHRNERAAA